MAKKIFIYFNILTINSLIFSGIALAQDSSLPAVNLTPDSSFYFLKSWEESIRTFFTFGAKNKAKQYFHLAEIRLAEYQKMMEKGKIEIAQKTLVKYQNQLNRALDKVKELQSKNIDIKDLSQKIEQAISKHLEILQQNLKKAPEQARQSIQNAIENASKVLDKNKKEGNNAGIANPASINCIDKGGTLEIRNDAEGNETGFCVFPDGSECEEWALFRGGCPKRK